MAVTLALVPPLPAEDTSPGYAADIMAVAEAMHAEGITPAMLREGTALHEAFAAPLAALTAARGTP